MLTGVLELLTPLVLALCTGAPTITDITPTPLPRGAQVEVSGAGFVPGDTTVSIGEVVQSVVAVDATHVRFAVATDTPLGPGTLTITAASEATSSDVVVVPPAPRITSVSPSPAVLGALVTVQGTGLATVTTATLDDLPCTITNQVATLLELRVPFEPALLGPSIQLLLTSPSGRDGTTLAITPPVPTIDTLTPNPVHASALLTVRGSILVQAPTVRVGGVDAAIVEAHPNELVVWVPPTVALGAASVVVRAAGKDSLPVSLVVQEADPLAPIVRAVYPSRVAAGGHAWVIGDHLDAIARALPVGTITLAPCERRVCRVATDGLAAGPPFVVALDGPHGAATFPAELVAEAPSPLSITRVEPSPARRGEPLSIYATHASAVQAVVIGGQVQTIDFFDEQHIVVTVHEQTPLGAETLFVTSNVGSEPFAVSVLDPVTSADAGPEVSPDDGAEVVEPTKKPADDGCAGGGGGLVVAALALASARRSPSRR